MIRIPYLGFLILFVLSLSFIQFPLCAMQEEEEWKPQPLRPVLYNSLKKAAFGASLCYWGWDNNSTAETVSSAVGIKFILSACTDAFISYYEHLFHDDRKNQIEILKKELKQIPPFKKAQAERVARRNEIKETQKINPTEKLYKYVNYFTYGVDILQMAYITIQASSILGDGLEAEQNVFSFFIQPGDFSNNIVKSKVSFMGTCCTLGTFGWTVSNLLKVRSKKLGHDACYHNAMRAVATKARLQYVNDFLTKHLILAGKATPVYDSCMRLQSMTAVHPMDWTGIRTF